MVVVDSAGGHFGLCCSCLLEFEFICVLFCVFRLRWLGGCLVLFVLWTLLDCL